ncbi:metallophosphoesterase [Laspinema olomoucense]|uniref:metallophosphoesterase n=1 Tax=Laspinema olomoucense TaxID=3231600 RepID=UPI0021BAFABE|nr:metallophosphoesterase [Laspinema sp. D3a]MCT7990050.1 metallophosphoesterase [Laspinema sp. D3a]
MHGFLTGSLKIERLNVAIADLPTHLRGTKLVQLSDFHYEKDGLSDKLLAEAIAASNHADPDLVLLTGDYVTHNPDCIYPLALQLKHLQSRRGIYGILGNHDIKLPHSKSTIITAFEKIGILILWNEVAYPLGAGLAVVGMAEVQSGQFNARAVFPGINESIPRIVLSHSPDTATYLQTLRVDLQLSGHTHGGQIILPKIGPLPAYFKCFREQVPKGLRQWIPYLSKNTYKIVERWEWSQGLHQVGNNQLYVSRGLGTYFPGRLFCPPEVTIITLHKSEDKKRE